MRDSLPDQSLRGRVSNETPPFKCSDHYCPAAEDLAITPAGILYPCPCFCGNNEFAIGAASDVEFAKSERYQRVRRRLATNTKSRSRFCRSCDIARTCASCPAAMLHANGSLNRPLKSICAFRIGMTEGKLLGLIEHGG